MTQPHPMNTQDLVGRLKNADATIDGITIHAIKTGTSIDIAKEVVRLKACAQEAAVVIEALVKALGPFATVARLIDSQWYVTADKSDAATFRSGCAWTDASGATRTLTLGDFRAARSALSLPEEQGEEGR